MKKFTKFSLITALILFVFGCVITVLFGFLGGFRQLRNMEDYPQNHFGIHFDDDGRMVVGFDEDDEDVSILGVSNTGKDGEKTPIPFGKQKPTKLKIEVGGISLYLVDSEDDSAWIQAKNVPGKLRYEVNGDDLEVVMENYHAVVKANKWHKESYIILGLPKGMKFETAEIDFGVGSCEIEELSAEKIDVSLGAGDMTIANMIAEKAFVEAGAGELSIADMNISEELEMNIGMGTAQADGTLNGDVKLACGMGNVAMNIAGKESDFDYEVSCGMGTVEIGESIYYTGEKEVDNGRDKKLETNCGMGIVEIAFENVD